MESRLSRTRIGIWLPQHAGGKREFAGKIHFTGQSLGGALAEYAALEYFESHLDAEPDVAKRISLTTFNGLGSADGLRIYGDKDPNILLAFDASFAALAEAGSEQVVHYFVTNDLIHALGGGHVGGSVYELAFRSTEINPDTNQPYLLNPVEAHRIETGFYREFAKGGLLDNPYFLAAQRRDDFQPISVVNVEKLAGYFSGLFNQRGMTEGSARYRLMAGVMTTVREAPDKELEQLISVAAEAAYQSGWIGGYTYRAIRDVGTSQLIREIKLFAQANRQDAAAALVGALFLEDPEWSGQDFAAVQALMSQELQAATTGMNAAFFDPSASRDRVASALTTARLLVPRSSTDRAFSEDLIHEPLSEAQILFLSGPNWLGGIGTYLFDLVRNRPEDFGAASHLLLAASVEFADYKLDEAGELVLSLARGTSNAFVELSRPVTGLSYELGTAVGSWREFSVFPEAYGAELVRTDISGKAREVLDQAREILEEAGQTVVLRQGRAPNPFASPDFDPDASPVSIGALAEGSVRTFTIYLPYDAGIGDQRVRLTLAGGAADKLTLLDHADEVALGSDGLFTLVVPEGRRELSFGLWAKEDIGVGAALQLSAQLVDGEDEPTHLPHLELSLALEGVDESPPTTTREIRGDWAPAPYIDETTGATYYRTDDLFNIERLPGVPSTGDVEVDLWLDGSAGADHVVTGDFDEQARGGGGDDFIVGSDASGNILIGGAGADRIEGGGWANHAAEYWEWEYLGRPMGLGDDKIYGGAGDDQIWAESEATQATLNDAGQAPTGITGDWLTGGSGADRIYGSAGDDVLLGGIGEDLLVGGAGIDVLLGDDDYQIRPEGNYWRVVHPIFGDNSGYSGFELGLFPVVNSTSIAPDLIWAVTGDPDFTYYKNGGGADVLIGGAGRDILIGQAGDDTLYGGTDDDILAGWEGDDELVGGAGNDLMAGDFGRDEQVNQRTVPGTLLVMPGVMGTAAAYGSAVDLIGNDLLDGGAGDDVLYGEGGDDSLLGGDGDDTLYGDASYLPEYLHGADILDGGDGDDFLDGGAGDDTLYGGAGDDTLYGGAGDDLIEGGGGDDYLYGDAGEDRLRGGEGNDELYGGDDNDELRAGAGDDTLDGGAGDDVLYGESGVDQMDGGVGNDRLYGGAGEDIISGGDGDDLIDGGEGIDVLRGGAGDDTYVLGFGYGRDIIEDGEGTNRIRFGSGIFAEDVHAALDSDTLSAVLTYGGIDDAVSIDLNEFSLSGVDFADGGSWTQKQFVDVLPAVVTGGSSGGETLEGHANLKNELRGRGGADALSGGGYDDLLDGGDGSDTADGQGGSDTYYYSGTESGFDRIEDSGIDTAAYLDWYYAALGIADWRARAVHGGEYRVVQHAEGLTFDVYYDSYEQALAENPDAAIAYLEPLPYLAPVVGRDDGAALDELVAAGAMARDVVRFGPSVALADLALRITVPGAAADLYPDQPWHDGGTLSVRWAEGGFEVAVPDVSYGFTGSSLPAEPDGYRLGEGIESFKFDDGSDYTLEEVLAQATVLPLAGDYHIARDSGPHLIAPNYEAIVFDDFIRSYEVQISRDGTDLLLTLGDGSAEGRVAGWYGPGGMTPPTSLRFYFDGEIDASTLTAAGLEVHGTEGDDVLPGLDSYRDALYGEGGDDLLAGGSGDDVLRGGDGADVYLLEAGGGHDVVENPYFWVWPSSDDRIRLANGLGSGDVLISHGYSDVSVWVWGSTTRIDVKDWLLGAERRLAGIEFADGTFWNADEMEARFEPAPGTSGDDSIFGTDGDDVIDALDGDDYVETGNGNDVVRGGPGADDLESWGDGNNFLDAGTGDDYVYEEGRALVIGGAGDDWIEHYGDGGVIAFNPGDGDDTVYAAGAMTLSIGGGVQPGDLSLGQDGSDLLLDVAGSGSIRLTRRWEDDPEAWPEITLQLFGSVHLYDFNAAIDALVAEADGAPAFALALGEVLAANQISFSEGDGLGGAIVWQFATTGSTGGLSNEQLRTVLADPGFGSSAQPIVLEQPNRSPQVGEPTADQSVREDALFVLSVALAFADPDTGDTLAYDAALADGSALPAWLGFDAPSATFVGTPGNDDVGSVEITVIATDGEGEVAADTFALEVVNVNDAPALLAPLPDQAGREGEALAFSLAAAFADVDAGDALAYAATLADGSALPAWLAFDPESASFSGTPGFADGGRYALRVTATDNAGASAAAEFALDVAKSAPPSDPGDCGPHGGHHHHRDEEHRHHGRGDGYDYHDTYERDDRNHDCVRERLARLPHFDFEALVREFDGGKRDEALSVADIRRGWERVARYAATLGAGGDGWEHGGWHGASDFLLLAPGGGHGFGFDASIGTARGHEDFKSFEGLREGFRRL